MSRSQASNAKAMQSKKWTICRIMIEGGTGDPKTVIWKPNSWAPASLALTFMVFPTIFQPPTSSKQNTSQKHSFSPSKTLYIWRLKETTPNQSTKPISPFPSTHSKTNHPSLGFFLQRGREVKGRLGRKRRNAGCCNRKGLMESMKKLDGESEDEKVGVEKRIKALQRLVPGGESLDPERLFEETADYILALEEQVNAMKVLASFFDGLEKEKTKVGG